MRSALVLLMTVLFVEIVNAQISYRNATRRLARYIRVKRQGQDKTKAFFSTFEKLAILDKHNEMRRRPKAADMEMIFWNHVLEKVSQDWANGCKYEHNLNRLEHQDEFMTLGENVFVTSALITNKTDKFMNTFYDEMMNYTYADNSCMQGAICGHYKQVVWSSSRYVGCGVRYCEKALIKGQRMMDHIMLVVCDYAPAGNIVGEKPFKVGKPCSDCPADSERCDDGLCRQEECEVTNCKNGGKFILHNCFCDCENTGFVGDRCEIGVAKDGKVNVANDATTNLTPIQWTHILGNLYLLKPFVLFVLLQAEFNFL